MRPIIFFGHDPTAVPDCECPSGDCNHILCACCGGTEHAEGQPVLACQDVCDDCARSILAGVAVVALLRAVPGRVRETVSPGGAPLLVGPTLVAVDTGAGWDVRNEDHVVGIGVGETEARVLCAFGPFEGEAA